MLKRYLLALGLTSLCGGLGFAMAQAPASGPVRVVIPWAAGGGTDLMGRALAKQLDEIWARPVVIDNKSGASGYIGSELVAKARPDGDTLLITGMSQVTTSAMFPQLAFDPQKDLVPIATIASYPHILVVRRDLPARNVEELIALARSSKNRLTYASAGSGSQYQLAAELFADLARVSLEHVPFKGGAPAVAAVLGGHVDMAFANAVQVLPHIRSGQLRALAITSGERLPIGAEIPTVAESGIPEYRFAAHAVLYGPAGLSPQAVRKINGDVVRALRASDLEAKLVADGAQVVASSPEESARLQQAETKLWKDLIERRRLKVD